MKKRYITVSLISLILVLTFIIIAISNNSHKTFKEDGITYALMVDGNSANSFPSKGMYQVYTECDGATGIWDYDNWKLDVKNITGNISCDISFNSISKEYLNQKIIGLSGTTQGMGQVVNEKVTIDKSTFTPTNAFNQSDYASVSNDTTYPWIWSDTNKTWTSSNKGDTAKSTTSTITFNPSTAGNYAICYAQSSEQNYDYGRIYKNGTEILSLKGKTITTAECHYLGNLTTSDAIKVTYQKDSSGNTGSDEVTFYMSSGTYNENIVQFDNDYRYEGKNPNNFVWFNNELWRIIGVFDSSSHGQTGENLVKIIRENSLGGLAWHKSNTNDWNASSLKALLNGAYYNQEDGTDSGYCYGYSTTVQSNCDYTGIGIDSSYRSMIKNVTWYLGGYSSTSVTSEAMYGYERGTTVYSGRPTSGEGYIGLMYPSDYGYSVLSSSCARTTNLNSYNNAACAGQSWLYKGGYEWTLSPNSSNSSSVFNLNLNGSLNDSNANNGYGARPVLYLDASVYVMDGDGSRNDPYIIGMG